MTQQANDNAKYILTVMGALVTLCAATVGYQVARLDRHMETPGHSATVTDVNNIKKWCERIENKVDGNTRLLTEQRSLLREIKNEMGNGSS